jgi:hypothetical protein
MAKIREYTSDERLTPSNEGMQAWEQAGRRIGPLYNEAGHLLEGAQAEQANQADKLQKALLNQYKDLWELTRNPQAGRTATGAPSGGGVRATGSQKPKGPGRQPSYPAANEISHGARDLTDLASKSAKDWQIHDYPDAYDSRGNLRNGWQIDPNTQIPYNAAQQDFENRVAEKGLQDYQADQQKNQDQWWQGLINDRDNSPRSSGGGPNGPNPDSVVNPKDYSSDPAQPPSQTTLQWLGSLFAGGGDNSGSGDNSSAPAPSATDVQSTTDFAEGGGA